MLSQPASQLGLSVGAGFLPAANPLAVLEMCPSRCRLCIPAGEPRSGEDAGPVTGLCGTSGSCRSCSWGAEGVTGWWRKHLLLLGDL